MDTSQNSSLSKSHTEGYSNINVQRWQLFVSTAKMTKAKLNIAFRSITKVGVGVSSSRFYERISASLS